MTDAALKDLLDDLHDSYNNRSFIQEDPISIPHLFQCLQDREIAGLWTAVLSWGQRKTIIQNAKNLMELMDFAPYDFVRNHSESDRKRFLQFRHRTFQPTDTLYFLDFFQRYYNRNKSLETAFTRFMNPGDTHVGNAIAGFHTLFFDSHNAPSRTRKHISTPEKKSSCKRLNMFLRWMVRKDSSGIDFGIWRSIRKDQLLIPLDIHVDRVSRRLGLLIRKQTDWKSVLELTQRLKKFDPDDPVKYDYALFGLGVLEKHRAI
jgi:uncharacterized protein (TIGR02757 family)